jgi:NIMA (never in mitosis gene a)-related kinase
VVILALNDNTETLVVKRKMDGKHFQAKKINLEKLNVNNFTGELHRERSWTLQQFKHPNISQYVESFFEEEFCIVISELCGYTDLASLIKIQKKKKEHFKEDQILSMVDTCVRVLIQAEDMGIVHGGI